MSNDFVAKELAICPVCGVEHMTGVLLHKRLRPIEDTVTHYEMCEEHKKLADEGYVAMVVIDETASAVIDDVIKPGEEYRTGEIIHARQSVLNDMLNVETTEPIIFINEEVAEKFHKLQEMTDEPK